MTKHSVPLTIPNDDAAAPLPDAALAACARVPELLVATDFDGTISPLVSRPLDARPLPGVMDTLRSLSRLPHTQVAVVSGRERSVLQMLTGVTSSDAIYLIGSHGAETDPAMPHATTVLSPQQQLALQELQHQFAHLSEQYPGTTVETKPYSVAFHTRNAAPQHAERAETEALELLHGHPIAHPMRGKCVVEAGVDTMNKGTALTRLHDSLHADALLYLGDDVTDETVFHACHGHEAHLTIKVGDGHTAARYRVQSVEDAAAVLGTCLQLRAAHQA